LNTSAGTLNLVQRHANKNINFTMENLENIWKEIRHILKAHLWAWRNDWR